MATPSVPQNASLWTISLPQKDGDKERLERTVQLGVAQNLYKYDPNNKLPMPMGTDEAAGIEFALLLSERLDTSNRVVGQLENQAAILVDLAISNPAKPRRQNARRAATKGLLPYSYFRPANIPNSTSV